MIKSHNLKKYAQVSGTKVQTIAILGAKAEYINHCIKSARKRNGNCLYVGTNDHKYESRPTEIWRNIPNIAVKLKKGYKKSAPLFRREHDLNEKRNQVNDKLQI